MPPVAVVDVGAPSCSAPPSTLGQHQQHVQHRFTSFSEVTHTPADSFATYFAAQPLPCPTYWTVTHSASTRRIRWSPCCAECPADCPSATTPHEVKYCRPDEQPPRRNPHLPRQNPPPPREIPGLPCSHPHSREYTRPPSRLSFGHVASSRHSRSATRLTSRS